MKILTNGNCAILAVKGTENTFEEIICGNCPEDIAVWSDGVKESV